MANEINTKYLPIFGDTRYYIITGGRGSGKSFAMSAILAGWTFKPSMRILFSRYTMTSAHISIIPEFTDKIDRMNAGSYFDITKSEITNKTTGSTILFRGLKTSSGNQTANLKSLQGLNVWVLDEAEELTDEKTFDKIDLSIRQQGVQNRVILILNPTTKDHWIYKRFFESKGVEGGWNGVKEDVTYVHTTYLDNIDNLDKSFIDQCRNIELTNPAKYRHVILGGWLDKQEGVIFSNWRYGMPDTSLPVVYGLDFGYSIDPTALTEVRVDEKRKIVYAKVLCYRKGMTTDQITRELTACGKNVIKADSAEGRLIDELSARGFNIQKAIKGPDSVRAGLLHLLNYDLVIHPDSHEAGTELNNYTWSDKKSNTPIDAYNHAIDSIRYAVYDPNTHKIRKFRGT